MIPALALLSSYLFCLTTLIAEPNTHPVKEEQIFFSIENPPDWITLYEVPFEYAPPASSEVNAQFLLIDKQENWIEKALHTHVSIKPLTKIGVEWYSKIIIDFDPHFALRTFYSSTETLSCWADVL